MDHFVDLPREMIVQICNQMSPQDLNKFVRTNTKIHKICQNILDKEKKKKIFTTFSDKSGEFLNSFTKYYKGSSGTKSCKVNFLIKDEYIRIDHGEKFIKIVYNIELVLSGGTYQLNEYIINEYIINVSTNIDNANEFYETIIHTEIFSETVHHILQVLSQNYNLYVIFHA